MVHHAESHLEVGVPNSGYGQSANGRRWALFSMHDLLHDQSSCPPSSAFALGAKAGFDMASAQARLCYLGIWFRPRQSPLYFSCVLIVCCPICTAIQYQYVLSLSSHICTSSYHMSQVAPVWYCIKSYLNISYDQHIILHVEWLKKT